MLKFYEYLQKFRSIVSTGFIWLAHFLILSETEVLKLLQRQPVPCYRGLLWDATCLFAQTSSALVQDCLAVLQSFGKYGNCFGKVIVGKYLIYLQLSFNAIQQLEARRRASIMRPASSPRTTTKCSVDHQWSTEYSLRTSVMVCSPKEFAHNIGE